MGIGRTRFFSDGLTHLPDIKDGDIKHAFKELMAVSWAKLPFTVINKTKRALSKTTEDKASQEALANLLRVAEVVHELSGFLETLKMKIDDIVGMRLENIESLSDEVANSLSVAFRRYDAYMDSFGPNEGYLRKKVENELGMKLIQLKKRCSGLGGDWSNIPKICRNLTHVSNKIAKHLLLSKEFSNCNFVFSPIPIHLVLGLLAAGSTDETQRNLLEFLDTNTTNLRFLLLEILPWIFRDSSAAGGPQLCFANGVWIDKTLSLKPSFKQVVDTVYKAACDKVDFTVMEEKIAMEVNLWVKKHTKGLIEEVISSYDIEINTWLLFVNAVYFNGSWCETFDCLKTRVFNFYLYGGKSVRVPFMTSNKKQFLCKFNDFTVLGLPYKQGGDRRKFTMYLFLPKGEKPEHLNSLISKLCSTPDFIGRHIPRQKVRTRKFFIPKFKISSSIEATDMLRELNLLYPEAASLTEMVRTPERNQTIEEIRVYQKAFIKVDEKGTTATAASTFDGKGCSRFTEYIDFVADRPFLVVTREDLTGAILFFGRVINPQLCEKLDGAA
ncbi:hypothetical protein M8C21_033615 [Ambrosia artemisiifolia]|uniref:Serpin domain-containing protein n=1 Tax=Ambrosia artemisiifolia TaxID=4212 RepID=A0AAD5C0Q6_AMBAR|nr:hypothetical protein M8C21_033615 [Ambrosia artemisiifolia]